MLRSYKYELRPTPEQANHLDRVFGSCRFIYNLALETKIQAYTKGKKLSRFDLSAQLTDLKKDLDWLYESPAQSLQCSISHLDDAFTNFFKKRAEFPRFKSKRSRQSYHNSQSTKVDWEGNRVFITTLKWISFHNSRQFTGTIRNSTVSKTTTGRYFISILVETGVPVPEKKPQLRETAVGIDVGLKEFAVLSDGTRIANPKFLFHSLKRLRVEQRTMARRFKKGPTIQSKGYQRQKMVVARLHEHVANQRKDFLHKLSTAIVKQYDTICVEDLNVAGMKQNRHLSRAISDVGWGEFGRQLAYKAEWNGKNLIEIGRFEPSSRICSECGWHNSKLKLSDREWTCANGHVLDRDFNAAQNIKNFALRTERLPANVDHLGHALGKNCTKVLVSTLPD